MPKILLTGTADTKGEELAFLRAILQNTGAETCLVDVGILTPSVRVDISAAEVSIADPNFDHSVFEANDRGAAVAAMSRAFAAYCAANHNDFDGVLGIGGGGGTSIVSAGMRALPYGIPKVLVSTLASSDTSAFIGVSDTVMFPAITDLAGLNRVSRRVLHNAAQALLGMTLNPAPPETSTKQAIGLSMFGVTTPCVTEVARQIGNAFDPLIFHATGTGGQTMERLLADNSLVGLIDVTLTEVCDLLVGGVLPCLPERLDVVATRTTPWVGAPGALDMVNFWAPDTVPEKFSGRKFYHHNPNVTLMRTTPEENTDFGRWVGNKLNACAGPVCVLLPEKGLSMLDVEGGDFWWPDADAALFDALENTIQQTENRKVQRLPFHINDPEFAAALAATFQNLSKD
ncbi:Tm-1-like ATP-binding domain-containing protein [Tropicibacter sp. Alg240-R139]|uniref:Tm-1-like ATP-binding domain-containing protein n=1 Tax=Tropicibacter sp. Alg240-R139 TaxID=2305991 RepID=UPI0013E0C8A7|nr:Tm-1-like ATP-binding domain-containing protein [Tropicibacter sp. Alg240-R139]